MVYNAYCIIINDTSKWRLRMTKTCSKKTEAQMVGVRCAFVELAKNSVYLSEGVEYAEEEASEGESEGAVQDSGISRRTGLANAMTKILSQDVGERKVRVYLH